MALAVAVLACGAPRLSNKASSRVHVYTDSRLTVVSPAVRDEVQVKNTRLGAAYAADVVTGASPALVADVVSAASPFTEVRHQLAASGSHAISPETEVSAGYAVSLEPDHSVHGPSVGFTQELVERMVRATARYQLLLESNRRVDQPGFAEWGVGHRVDLGWTQIATPRLVWSALATGTAWRCGETIGCLANPYRSVGVELGDGDRVALPERHPSSRLQIAAALRASWSFHQGAGLHGGYRFSADTWGVTAHTADLSAAFELFDGRLLLRCEARGTAQSAASFYRARYEGGVPAVRTGDAELSRLWNARAQLHLEWAVGPVRVVGSFGRMWNLYPDYPALRTRHAWLVGLGVDLEL